MWIAYLPVYRSKEQICQVEHEATTSKIGEDQIFIAAKRNWNGKAIALVTDIVKMFLINYL